MVICRGWFETVPCRATLATPFPALCPRILRTRCTNYGLRVSGFRELWAPLVPTNSGGDSYGPIIGPYPFLGKFVWSNGPESSSKVSLYAGIGPWMALPKACISPALAEGSCPIFHALVRGGQTCNNYRAKWFGLFLFILLKKALDFKESPGGKSVKNCGKVRKSVEECRNDFALQLLPFSFSLLLEIPKVVWIISCWRLPLRRKIR